MTSRREVPPARAWVAEILGRHLARYPAMGVVDVYKLLHQSAMGPGHAVDDPIAARLALLREIADLEAGSRRPQGEPVVDAIAPGDVLVRVHLAPYAAAGLDPERLAGAFVATAEGFVPRPDVLAERCDAVVSLAREGSVPLDADEVEVEVRRLAERGFPAVRHSEAYRARYRPAYRVVAADTISLPGDDNRDPGETLGHGVRDDPS